MNAAHAKVAKGVGTPQLLRGFLRDSDSEFFKELFYFLGRNFAPWSRMSDDVILLTLIHEI